MEFKIKEIRIKKGITLYNLSKSTGIDIKYLRELENNNKSNPSFIAMAKIAFVLDVKLEELYVLNIEKLRNELYYAIDKYGLNSRQARSISKLLDILLIDDMK